MNLTDSSYLDGEYGITPNYLAGRADFYSKFLRCGPSWRAWLADALLSPAPSRVLDIGCGDGSLWHAAKSKGLIPTNLAATLVDRSAAMVTSCQGALSRDKRFGFAQEEGTAYLRSETKAFDLIFAGHLVYHLEQPADFVGLARERLTPGGVLALTSVGEDHLKNLEEQTSALFLGGGHPPQRLTPPTFRSAASLRALLDNCFKEVEIKEYKAELVIDDPAVLIDFLASRTSTADQKGKRSGERIRRYVHEQCELPVISTAHNLLALGRKHD